MGTFSAALQETNFSSVNSVAKSLKRVKPKPDNYARLIKDGLALGEYKGRFVVKALLSNQKKLKDRNQVLVSVRKENDPGLRREVVRAYKESKRDLELITGMSVMSKKDALKFMKDYFSVGGNKQQVYKWLFRVAEMYVAKKRSGKIKPDFDYGLGDFCDDVEDFFGDIGSGIAEAFSTVWDALVKAGEAFVDFAEDVLSYAQSRINDLIEVLLDTGREVGEFISAVIDKGVEAVKKIYKAIVAAGRKAVEIFEWLYENAKDRVKEAIEILVGIGYRIKDLLAEGLELASSILNDFVGYLLELGHSVWYILKWTIKQSLDTIKGVLSKLIEIGHTLGDLANWLVNKSLDVLKKGFQALLAIGKTAYEIVQALLTDPGNFFDKALKALKELGEDLYDFFKAAADLGVDFISKVYDALKKIGLQLIDILDYAFYQTAVIAKEICRWLLQTGIKVFEMLTWAINKTVAAFIWMMDAIDVVFEALGDIVVWVCSLGGPWAEHLAKWIVDKAGSGLNWAKDKIILPLIAIGKITIMVMLAEAFLPFLAIAFAALKRIADDSQTDYKKWPAKLNEFISSYRSKLIQLAPVDDNHKYVVISDVHKESQADIDGNIGHFYKNKTLFRKIIENHYLESSWTLITVGDDEEFWYSADLEAESDPIKKAGEIVNTHKDLYTFLSENFYKYQNPRRFIKIRGNHDDAWQNSSVANKLKNNGFPDIEIYEHAVFDRKGEKVLIMHGHQFDPYNCDANNNVGKLMSNFVGESFDTLGIEGWTFAPFREEGEWKDTINGNQLSSDFDSGLMLDETLAKEQIKKYKCSLILGHTHGPKLLRLAVSDNTERFYANAGTSGWWEHCVITIEVTLENVILKVWSDEDYAEPFRTVELASAATFNFS